MTVVAVGHLVHDALAVAEELDGEVSVEVFDPRTLYPFDWELLAESLGADGRGSSSSTTRTAPAASPPRSSRPRPRRCTLVARPRRVTRADAPIAFAVELERAALPSRAQLAAAVRAVAGEQT